MPRVAHPRFAPDCTIEVDGRPIPARSGESVAVALIAAGVTVVGRSAKYHRPRGPFCLAGSCHSCLARIDGVPNRRTCRTRCRPGLTVQGQNAFPSARDDALGAIDHLCPRGLDHHHLLTWSALANRAAVAVSRRLAGSGLLPGAVPPPWPATVEEPIDALVIGAGPAGLGAAEALARAGRRVLLAESGDALGGRLRCGLERPGDPPLAWAREIARGVTSGGGEVALGATAVGLWNDGGAPVVVLRQDGTPDRLRCVRPRATVLATGTYAVPPSFGRSDLPGIYDGRALARALLEDGLLPGRRCVVAGGQPEAEGLVRRLGDAGVEVCRSREVVRARGGRRLAAAVVPDREVRCEALAWFGWRSPASELAREAGAPVDLDESGGWRVRVDETGATGVRGVWAAGEVVAPRLSAAGAAAQGIRAGEAAGGD